MNKALLDAITLPSDFTRLASAGRMRLDPSSVCVEDYYTYRMICKDKVEDRSRRPRAETENIILTSLIMLLVECRWSTNLNQIMPVHQ